MSKKVKVLISILAVSVLALAVPTAAVMAQDDEPATAPPAKQFIARVADILGIDQGELADAFEQVRQEMRGEGAGRCTENATQDCIKERLNSLITKCRAQQHRIYFAADNSLAQGGKNPLCSNCFAMQKIIENIIIKVSSGLNNLLSMLLCHFAQFLRDFATGQGLPLVIFGKQNRFFCNQVNHSQA